MFNSAHGPRIMKIRFISQPSLFLDKRFFSEDVNHTKIRELFIRKSKHNDLKNNFFS